MNNPATVSDLTDRGYTGGFDAGVQQTRLNEAWRAVQLEVPSLVARITSGDLDVAGVIDVLCAAALRILRNPEGVEEESGSLDDYRETWKRSDVSSDLYFTSAELRRLAPIAAALTGFTGAIKYC